MDDVVSYALLHARASATSRAARSARASSVTPDTPRSAASATMADQWAAGMPLRAAACQLLTVESDCPSASATAPVPPQATMIDFQSVMDGNIVRNSRTCQAVATCEATNSPIYTTIRRMDTDLEISNRLAALREKLGLDQVAFAKSLGIEKNTYNAYERGKRPLTIETAKKIRRRYGISVDWLLFGDVGQPNHEFLLGIQQTPEVPRSEPVRKRRTAV